MDKKLQLIMVFVGGFMVLAIWRNPATAASDFGAVLGNMGTFMQEVLGKFGDFIGNLG
ncbi:MAG TPA: hypothetical protein VL068_07800 [Microthrixaceae bacterium]|nr:hypothetical protein [Microthrixaceae bacterium]